LLPTGHMFTSIRKYRACIETGSGRAEFQGYHIDISKPKEK